MIQPPFDEKLYTLKLAKLSRELNKKIYPAERRVFAEQRKIGQGHGASFYAKLADTHLELLREFLEGVDRICREVWETQGQNVTPEFVRAVIKGHIFSAIAARTGSTRGELELMARRTGFSDLATPLGSLARKRGQLESEWSERYEIEAIELEHSAKSKAKRDPVDTGNGSGAAPQAKPSQSDWSESSPVQTPLVAAVSNRGDLWRDFQDRFMRLAREEQGRGEVITTAATLRAMNQLLRAYCTYRKHPEGWERGKPDQGMICLLDTPPHGVWNYSDGVSENFRERLRLCVAEAGRALPGYPKGTDAEDFWLHRLYLGLLENNSEQLFAASQDGGMIVSVCVASATFCSRLERKAMVTLAPNAELAEPETDPKTPGSWIRAEKAAWTQLERRGDQIVLGGPSNDTATQIRHDYDLLYWNVRQLNQWVSQKAESGQNPGLQDVKTAFNGTILIGDAESVPYLTDRELQGLIIHPQTPSTFAESTIAKRWGFTHATVKTYLRRKSSRKSKKQ